MKSIFYFSHIPWNWIKQRPQFLAEELSKNFKIIVCQDKVYNYKPLITNKTSLIIKTLFRLPFARILYIQKINLFLAKLQLKPKIKKFDCIWLTSPLQYHAVRTILNKDKIVIYDCMDDILAFPIYKKNKAIFEIIRNNENLLLRRADIIFCSSSFLKEALINRYKTIPSEKITIINNAITIHENNLNLPDNIHELLTNHPKNLCYIGTISQWFDFDLIVRTLERYKNLYLILFGPSEISIPNHKQIIYWGSVDHKYIYPIMKKAGVLIMPFIVNDLILSVNPVKLYEYIYSEKASIAKMYPEVLKFNDYVYLYDSAEQFIELIDQYYNSVLPLKQPKEQYHHFGINNTWEARAKEIKKIMDAKLNIPSNKEKCSIF